MRTTGVLRLVRGWFTPQESESAAMLRRLNERPRRETEDGMRDRYPDIGRPYTRHGDGPRVA